MSVRSGLSDPTLVSSVFCQQDLASEFAPGTRFFYKNNFIRPGKNILDFHGGHLGFSDFVKTLSKLIFSLQIC